MFIALAAGAVTVDDWALAGHGNSRQSFAGHKRTERIVKMSNLATKLSCTFPRFNTPFSSTTVASGAQIRSDGMMHAALTCNGTNHVWEVNLETDKQRVVRLNNTKTWDSYLRYLPDGSIVGGVDGHVVVLDNVTLQVKATQPAGGDCGMQVAAVSKTNPPQLQSAGGCGGWDWWGSSCDIINGSELTNCKGNSDTTVCMGADGLSMFNNQRFEQPTDVVRYTLPFGPGGGAKTDKTGYLAWPWWIRSDTAGNVVSYDGQNLRAFAKDATALWSLSIGGKMGLMISDDEDTILLSDTNSLVAVTRPHRKAASTDIKQVTTTYASMNATSCQALNSPWQNALPVPLPASAYAALVCSKQGRDKAFVKVLNVRTGNAGATFADLTVPPSQVLVDNSAMLYSLAIVEGQPQMQAVDLKNLS